MEKKIHESDEHAFFSKAVQSIQDDRKFLKFSRFLKFIL